MSFEIAGGSDGNIIVLDNVLFITSTSVRLVVTNVRKGFQSGRAAKAPGIKGNVFLGTAGIH